MTFAPEPVCTQVEPGDAAELARLFDRADSPCFCRYWHFDGDRNAWLARCALERELNRTELALELSIPAGRPHGVVARIGPTIVGWMKLTPVERVQKLYQQRPYRGLGCFSGERSRILTLGCVLVDPEVRRRGIARRMIEHGIVLARRMSASAIEAFPRRGDPLRDEELLGGPFSSLNALGFQVAHDFGPYPVLRLALG